MSKAFGPALAKRFPALLALLVTLSAASPALSQAATQEDKTQFTAIAGSLAFSTTPGLPTLAPVTLAGQAETTDSTMTNFGVVDATGAGAGWNVTVQGLVAPFRSAVFRAYCPKAKCGAEAEGYVTGGATLPADSLNLFSTGAALSGQNGSTGTAPTLQCAAGCPIDSAAAETITIAAKGAGMGTWLTGGFTPASLQLSTPASLKLLPNEEVYRVNVLWTLSTGP